MQGAPNKSLDRNADSLFFNLIVEIDDVVNRGTRSTSSLDGFVVW